MRNKTFAFFLLAVAVFLFPGLESAKSKTETCLDEAEMCLDTVRIRETRIIDDQTVLFIMRSGDLYLNRLPSRCVGLRIAGGFSYGTSVPRLCKQDIITTVGAGSASGNTCSLGEFMKFKEKMRPSEAVKLLQDGLLDELVAEGAFKEHFSDKK